MLFNKLKISYVQLIAASFLLVILLGSFLLCLPIASRSGEWTPYINSIYTATSATCVTGLVIYDTFAHWTIFGQIVILCLIQVGGIGFMTLVSMMSIVLRRHIGLYERKLIMQSTGTLKISGAVRLIKRVILGTFVFEGIGALLLSLRFVPDMGFFRGIYNGVFHSVSAFCNAGFDLMGRFDKFSSLTSYADDPLVNFTVAGLIVVGGIGFFVWSDLYNCRFRFRKLQLHSKVVLTATIALIAVSTIAFFIMEFNHAFREMNTGGKLMASVFQAVTPRTAGFNTVDLNSLSEGGGILTIVLMFIGGTRLYRGLHQDDDARRFDN